MTVYTVEPTPVTVRAVRLRAELDEPDRLDVIVTRGKLRLGSLDIYRGEVLCPEVAKDWGLSDNERDQISAICIQNWIHWPAEKPTVGEVAPQLNPELLEQFDALKKALGG